MVTTPEYRIKETNGLEVIVEEFTQKLRDSIRLEREKSRELADKEAKNIMAKAYQEAAALNEIAKEESTRILDQSRASSLNESSAVLKQAQQQSMEITQSAENEAAKITNAAQQIRQKALEELADVQKLTAAAIEKAVAEWKQKAIDVAVTEAVEIINQAKIRAQKEQEEIISLAHEEVKQNAEPQRLKLLEEARLDAENILEQARAKVRTQIDDTSRLMQEIQQKMQQVITTGGIENYKPSVPVKTNIDSSLEPQPQSGNKPVSTDKLQNPPAPEPKETLTEAQSKLNSILVDESGQDYKGKIKIDIAPPVDKEQINLIESYLLKNSNIEVGGRGNAEDGSAWLQVDILQSIPLLTILRKIPCIKEVVGARSYIIVALKSKL